MEGFGLVFVGTTLSLLIAHAAEVLRAHRTARTDGLSRHVRLLYGLTRRSRGEPKPRHRARASVRRERFAARQRTGT